MPQESNSRSASEPARILIVEDHLDSREALRILLEAVGYRVSVATDGRNAVDVALAEHPDLILMDIMMPKLDGFEATRRLREDGSMGRVPIIAVTAMEGAQGPALQAGANAVMAKPIDTRALLSTIQDFLYVPEP